MSAWSSLVPGAPHLFCSAKQNKKDEALFGLFLGIIFLTPLFALFVYVGIKFELINFPIIGELLFIGFSLLFIGFWWVIISNLIEAFKNKKEDNVE